MIDAAAGPPCAAMDALWALHEEPRDVPGDVEVHTCVLQLEQTPKRPREVRLVADGAQHGTAARDPTTSCGGGVVVARSC